MTATSIGIDFGTTKSSIARASGSGEVELAQFPQLGGRTASYRSLLYLEQVKERGRNLLKSWSGPEGIERYLAADHNGRFMQSLKSFLSNRNIHGTEVFGRKHTIEERIARILRDLRERVSEQFGAPISHAVVGRPVRFVGAETDEDDRRAETRLKKAFALAGYDSVHFELEPIAAAHYYESTLRQDELILIGDFGGGTRWTDTPREGSNRCGPPWQLRCVGIAGDSFDARLIRHLVSPSLGAGTNVHSMKCLLPVPAWIYGRLERRHHLSFLKAREVMDLLTRIHGDSVEPEKIASLIHLVKEDRGYQLHQSVQAVKYNLSRQDSATFHFEDGTVNLRTKVSRSSFEQWIHEELKQIEACLDSLLRENGVHPRHVDTVFLTGGSSFVPAVRRIFTARFGAERIRTGNAFTSVAWGLALRGSSHSPGSVTRP